MIFVVVVVLVLLVVLLTLFHLSALQLCSFNWHFSNRTHWQKKSVRSLRKQKENAEKWNECAHKWIQNVFISDERFTCFERRRRRRAKEIERVKLWWHSCNDGKCSARKCSNGIKKASLPSDYCKRWVLQLKMFWWFFESHFPSSLGFKYMVVAWMKSQIKQKQPRTTSFPSSNLCIEKTERKHTHTQASGHSSNFFQPFRDFNYYCYYDLRSVCAGACN